MKTMRIFIGATDLYLGSVEPHVTDTILGYIKPATCLHHLQKTAATINITVEAEIVALLASEAAKQKHKEVEDAIDQANLPKDSKTFKDSVIAVMRSEGHPNKPKPKQKHPQNKQTAKTTPKKGKTPNPKHTKPSPKGKGAQKDKPLSTTPKGNHKKKQNQNTNKNKANNNKVPHKPTKEPTKKKQKQQKQAPKA